MDQLAKAVQVYFGDRFVSPNEARIALLDPGYLLGEGAFATLRGYDGVCFRAEKHFATLARGAALFGMAIPVPLARLKEIVDEAAARTKVPDAYVRVTLTKSTDESHPILSVIARALDVPRDEDYAHGISTKILTARSVPPACMDTTVKTTSYAPHVLARREAASAGVQEGIVLAIDGALASGTMSNIFLVSGKRLLTPHVASGCRAGVTREAVMEIASAEGFEVEERRIEPDELFVADEAFFTSTRVECLPIASVDGRAIGRGEQAALLRAKLSAQARSSRAG